MRRGFDVVFDAIAGPYFSPAYMRLRPEGRHVIYGAADYMTHGARPATCACSAGICGGPGSIRYR